MQSFFIGVGSVVASLLPWLLTKAGVGNIAGPGEIPQTVKYAFYFGAVVLLVAVGWTIVSTREYPPDVLKSFDTVRAELNTSPSARTRRDGFVWSSIGIALLIAVAAARLDKQLYLLGGGMLVYGVALLFASYARSRTTLSHTTMAQIMSDVHEMPGAMRRLAVVQFFSWFALFAMWTQTTVAVTARHYGTTDTQSALYNEGANWVGVLFATYNGFAVLAAILIPWMVSRLGLRVSHLINVWLGSAGLISFLFIRDPQWLVVSMIGVGFAWASIVSLPYALLADSVPAQKMGVYMGIFNLFIVIPQLLAATLLGFLLKSLFGGQSIYALVIGGISLFVAGLCVLRVEEPVIDSAARLAPSE
jgi:maltose/moltooligosaccharide transporter